MWITSSIILLIGAMSMSTDLSDYLDNERLYYGAPLLVLLMAMLIAIIVQIKSPKYTPSNYVVTDKGMETAINMGYKMLRNMALCIGMLCIDSVALFLDDILNPETAIYYKIYKLTSVVEPAGIAILLWTLRKQLRHSYHCR
jgi:hypothetical protein